MRKNTSHVSRLNLLQPIFFFTFQIVFSVEEIYSPQKSMKQAKLLAQKAENTWFFYFINSMLPFESDLAPL